MPKRTTKSVTEIVHDKEGGGDDDNQTQSKRSKLESFFNNLTGYDVSHFQNYANFTNWLHRPVDASALGVFRMLYGLAMLVDIAEERGGSQMDVRFGDPQYCHFPLFSYIKVVSLPIIGCIYLTMWLGAIGIMFGYRFRLSCLAYIVPYWYLFLLDKAAWNNHSYLFGLVGTLLIFTNANRYCSLDKYLNPSLPTTVPYWNYFLIKFQFFILYMYAGLKKFTAEWLSGYSMTRLSYHWVFAPMRLFLSAEMIDLLIIHWFTAIFDFSIAFFMTCKRTRLFALPFMLSFHLMNSRLFIIGMFPWVCLAQVPMFFGFDWPKKICVQSCYNAAKNDILNNDDDDDDDDDNDDTLCKESSETSTLTHNKEKNADKLKCDKKKQHQQNVLSFRDYARTTIILSYCAFQLFMPYSHFITKGYNNWNSGLYGYSWDMMVYSYDTVLTSIKIVDNDNGRVHYFNPYAFTDYDRWTKYADMAIQYAKCIEKNILEDYARDPKTSPLTSTNFSIYFDIWSSVNGRFQQRVFHPNVDLLKAEWSPFQRTSWSLPLLNELNHMRPKLRNIADEVLAWNNYSDVIFVADFPGLTLDNHIAKDLTNVSLTVLEGNIRYKSDNDEEFFFLTAGKSIPIKSDTAHHVTTIGLKPSCYLYTYINKTMMETNTTIDDLIHENKPLLPIWQEFKDRVANHLKFITHISNCILYLLYNVPIPIEIRDRD